MSVNYFNTDEVIAAKMPAVTNTDDKAIVTTLCLAVSRFIDAYCKRPVDYFAPLPDDADDDSKTVRKFRSNGSRFLQIPRHVAGSVELTNPAVSDSSFYEGSNGWIYASEQSGIVPDDSPNAIFLSGALYEVKAHWFFETTPADVLEAGMQIIEAIWSKGKGVIGEITPDGFVVDRAIPLTAAAMLKPYIKRQFEVE